jgi:hypothetical protein
MNSGLTTQSSSGTSTLPPPLPCRSSALENQQPKPTTSHVASWSEPKRSKPPTPDLPRRSKPAPGRLHKPHARWTGKEIEVYLGLARLARSQSAARGPARRADATVRRCRTTVYLPLKPRACSFCKARSMVRFGYVAGSSFRIGSTGSIMLRRGPAFEPSPGWGVLVGTAKTTRS